jgi:multidrug resistance efflux pump
MAGRRVRRPALPYRANKLRRHNRTLPTVTAFTHTLRSLQGDRSSAATAGLLIAIVLLAAWLGWCAFARIRLHETTSDARLEVDRAVHPVQSPLAGKVARTWLATGRAVRAGDPLFELDTSAGRLEAAEERARLLAVNAEVAARRREIVAEENARKQERHSARASADEARAGVGQADAAARFAAGQAERASALDTQGATSKEQLARMRAAADQARFAVERARAALHHIEQEQLTRESEREVRIRRLEVEIARLEGQAVTRQAGIDRLDNEIELRTVRAPVDGFLAEAATLRVGAVLSEAEHVASLVPAGTLMVVARFSPPAALGRIAPGQTGTLRLDGFPWAEYGAIRMKVMRVASEIRDGRVRVELVLDGPPPARIPLQHGLPGIVEVEVERTTPMALILRAAGSYLGAPRPGFAAQTP